MAQRVLRAAAVAVFGLAVATVPTPISADPGIEGQVMAKIRAGRSGGLIQHSGLHAVARQHSMYMSRTGRMSHDNADQRITNAPPDPFETNGAPDDGVPVAAWCENVTYSTGHPASEVPQRLYSQWQGSGAHARCMRDTGRNVGAVGVYYDGTTWWATFIATTDNTPPGGAAPKPQRTSAPAPRPAAETNDTPAATTAPTRSYPTSAEQETSPTGVSAPASADPSGPVTEEFDETTLGEGSAEESETEKEPGRTIERPANVPTFRTASDPLIPEPVAADLAYGWQELAAVGGVLAIASLIIKRRRRAAAPVYLPPDIEQSPMEQPEMEQPAMELPEIAPPEVEQRNDEAQPERELVGAGASYSGVERHALASLTLS